MTSSVQVALRIRATPERVFRAFTEDIAAWWRPNSLFTFTPRAPGVLAFEPGVGGRFTETLANGHVFEIGRITAWSPPHRLAFTWRQATFPPDVTTKVEVRFDPVSEDETRVTVEHEGWSALPATHVAKHGIPDARFLELHGAWWFALLGAMRNGLREDAAS